VVCDIIMLYALEERKVYKKSIIDNELRSANMAIAKTAFALVNRAVSNLSTIADFNFCESKTVIVFGYCIYCMDMFKGTLHSKLTLGFS